MPDTDGEKEVKSFWEQAQEATESDYRRAVQFAQLSLAESAVTYLAMLQGGYARSIGDWLWEPAEEAGYTQSDVKSGLPADSGFWTDAMPQILQRVVELKFPNQEEDFEEKSAN
jgi:hypothetical protein